MMNIKKILEAVVLFVLMIGSANAFIIDSSTSNGDTFSVDWLLSNGGTDGNGNVNGTGYDILGEALFTFLEADITLNTISFDITLSNTTAANNDVNIGLQKFGFGTTPNATSATFSDFVDEGVISATLGTTSEFPDSAIIDLLALTGTGAPRSIQAGESDTFNLVIGFSDLAGDFSVGFDPFNVKYQSDEGSYEFGPGVSVPEPSVFALMGLGLVGLGFSRRRK